MDLSAFYASDEAVWFQLENPVTYEPLFLGEEETKPVRVALLAETDPAVDAVEKKITSDIFQRAQRSRTGRNPITQEDNERYSRMRFAARIKDWENIVVENEALPCTAENKRLIHDDSKRFGWMRQQIERYMLDSSAFLAGNPKS